MGEACDVVKLFYLIDALPYGSVSSAMSCLSVFYSFFRKSEAINGESYTVIKRIGEGGFSFVDLVTRNHTNYALKRMLLQVPEQREAAENEVRTHCLMNHDNIIKLVASEIKDQRNGEGVALLLFPFYQNGTLQDLMEHVYQTGIPLSEGKVLKQFIFVCKGLQAMHTCSAGPLVHNDIKPGNLLISNDGKQLVLMDLGSTRDAEIVISNRQEALAFQESCAQTCTAHYRAPELFEVPSNCTITAKTDVWSLGCSLYATVFGQSPCDGTALAANSGRIVFPRNHTYSEEFCTLILWILNVHPETRPSVSEVQLRIETILQESDTSALTS